MIGSKINANPLGFLSGQGLHVASHIDVKKVTSVVNSDTSEGSDSHSAREN